ncbi:MAG: hypothetical protein ACYC0B_02265 [Gemmatimonadaceae bacterium]
MTNDEYWTVRQLREFLKIDGPTKESTWYRHRPLFAPALRQVGHLRYYNVAKVREILENGRLDRRSPVRKSLVLRKTG